MRTCIKFEALLELPSSRWDGPAAIIHPFRIQANASTARAADDSSDKSPSTQELHPICRVIAWQSRLDNEPGLIKAQIARDEGISRAIVTQMFGLLHLAPSIRSYLASLRNPLIIGYFSVRRLLTLAQSQFDLQIDEFELMKVSAERRTS